MVYPDVILHVNWLNVARRNVVLKQMQNSEKKKKKNQVFKTAKRGHYQQVLPISLTRQPKLATPSPAEKVQNDFSVSLERLQVLW